MAVGYVLYNEKAGDRASLECVRMLEVIINDEIKFMDVVGITDYGKFLSGLAEDDYIILAGGDGTLNRFVNNIEGFELTNEVLYFPIGTGNDFARDLGYGKESNPFPVTDHIKDLPFVTVKGRRYRFINGVGYGIDGYCCEEGDKLKQKQDKRVNYTSVAIKGVLGCFKPVNAKVIVDGKSFTYKKVWMAPTMNGRYYGDGMMPAPSQRRNTGAVSVVILHNSSRLKTLMMFPSIFKGKHIKFKNHIEIMTGQSITVEFDRPTPLQIDGETVSGVWNYTVQASSIVRSE